MLLEDTGTHYAVLGISELASPEEIKKAFRRNARRCHPDIVGTSDPDELVEAERQFKALSHAYDVLIDPDARRQYDRTYSATRFVVAFDEPQPQPQPQPLYVKDGDADHLDEAWKDFISKPFQWSEKTIAFYLRWEWVLSIFTLVVVGLFLTGQVTLLSIFTFLLTTHSAPAQESAIPAMWMIIGGCAAFVLTVLVGLQAVITHRYSMRHSKSFRGQLLKQANNMLMTSGIVFSVAGLLIGHYLF